MAAAMGVRVWAMAALVAAMATSASAFIAGLSGARTCALPASLSPLISSKLSPAPVAGGTFWRLGATGHRRTRILSLNAEDEEKPIIPDSKTMGQNIGRALSGATKSWDAIGESLGVEEEEEAVEEPKTGKDALFGGREQKIFEAMEKDLQESEGGESEELPECPEPILFAAEDFEKSVWRIQVEKSGNWFTGNYVPSDFRVAFSSADDGLVEYGGDPFTKGKWYCDGSSVYFDRRPFAALGPLGPGCEYFRATLQGWANDELQLQSAGYVSGYSPLFPTAVLGKFLMTREKKSGPEEIAERKQYSAKELRRGGGEALPEAAATKKKMMLDLSEELSDEERRRKEAAEWMPSTIVDTKPKVDVRARE
uniref:Uncharacterized protein n=1 Tax=Guillardia theta TaxID=55529 RepID=A0A7S4P490_GUITH|mmetsp:Transcript_42798/g.134880  ORF Transcript_42798/g.134880 Transcript_42798/m.134880 type:complete len:367 (+) Transcript_42798:55-1155(+)